MPTYSYECTKCGHVHDVFHAMSATPRVKCEQCGKACKRLLGTGAGIIFKGSGFYETDYKKKGGTGRSEPSKASESKASESKPSGSSDAGKSDSSAAKSSGSKSKSTEAA